MDPVMQAVFGDMPIDKLISSKTNQVQVNNSGAIFLAIGTILVLGVTAYVLYKKNRKLKEQLDTSNL